MAWTVVNPDRSSNAIEATACKHDNLPDLSSSETVSKYRVNILAAAEKLVTAVPRRKRRSLAAFTGSSPKKFKCTLKTTPKDSLISKTGRSARIRTPLHAPRPDDCSVAEEPISTNQLSLGPRIENDALDDCIAVPVRERSPSIDREGTTAARQDVWCAPFTSMQAKSPSAYATNDDLSAPIDVVLSNDSIEISSDTPSFDDFDDSIFDEYIQSSPITIATPTIMASPHTPVTTASAAGTTSPTRRPLHPLVNETPLQPRDRISVLPFMHPCLLDSLDAKAMAIAERHITMPLLKRTCFRTAEVLRLTKALQARNSLPYESAIELFALVKEVEYANSLGRGQGVTFADIFFPGKPPYITTSSKIPYRAQDLMRRGKDVGVSSQPVKAVIKCCVVATTKNSLLAGRSLRNYTFEVIDICQSSWQEIVQVKSLIDRDLKARHKRPKASVEQYVTPHSMKDVGHARTGCNTTPEHVAAINDFCDQIEDTFDI